MSAVGARLPLQNRSRPLDRIRGTSRRKERQTQKSDRAWAPRLRPDASILPPGRFHTDEILRMRRRDLLRIAAAGAAALAIPRVTRAERPLRFIPQADLAALDPVWTTAQVTLFHAHLVFDTLYGLDGAYQVQPQMVEGHRLENDGRLWTLTLREGLRFHDGEPVRGRDAVASIKRWAARDAFGTALIAATDELYAPSDRTIRFRLKKPF